MTKSDIIRALAADGHSARLIAEEVGCSTAYVRVVSRQRANGMSDADKRYYAANTAAIRERVREWMRDYQRERYATDPVFRAARLKASADSKKRRKEREGAQ